MNSNIYTIIGFLCTTLTFTVALHLKPQNEPTAVDDPNEFVVSFKSKCLNETTNGTVPMDLFQDFICIQTNNFSFSTSNITNPNDPSDIYDEVAIFFKIGNDSTCLEDAEIDFECIVYSAYSPKVFEDGLDFSTRASHTTTGLPGKETGLGEAINLDLLNNKQPYLTENDHTFHYYPIDKDDPGVDIYMIDSNINVNHLEFQGIKDQIEVEGPGRPGSNHGTQVLSVMIGKNRGILRGWPGKGKSKVYVYLMDSFGDIIEALDLWTKSPKQYLHQKPPRKAVINLSLTIWRNLLLESHRDDIKHLATAIKRATQLDAIVVAGAAQDSDNFPNGVNICQDTPEVWGIKGKWRSYPGSWGNDRNDPPIITVAAFSYGPKDVQPIVWTYYGESCVDLWAIGASVIVPSDGNTAYESVHGTSVASPVIASLAAIELARDSTLKGEKDDMVKRLKQCGRGFWIKPSTPAAKIKCPQPDSCWAASYICEEKKTCKMDVALLVDVSTKMTSKECKRQQLEVAETLGGFRGEETITEGGLTYPLVRVSYIEFDRNAIVITRMNDNPNNQHQTFSPVDALQTLCIKIRDRDICDESIKRKPIGLFDWYTWLGLFTTVLYEFEISESDALKRAKNAIIFRNHVQYGTIPRPKRRLLDDDDPSVCDNDDVNVVLVNNRANATSMVNDSYLMCLVEYDDDRIMWNNVSQEHFPLIDAISEQLTCINDIPPTTDPTVDPTIDPTFDPTRDPTIDPTRNPTGWTLDTTTSPTSDPTLNPSRYPTTNNPTSDPTIYPTIYPSRDPTTFPSDEPSTNHPTSNPTTYPTTYPTSDPSTNPTSDPTTYPTRDPSTNPTSDPTTKSTSTSTLTCHDIGFDLRKGKTPLPHDCKCQSECGGRYCNSFVWITQRLNYAFDIDDEELLCDGFPDSMCCCSCPNCYGFIRLS